MNTLGLKSIAKIAFVMFIVGIIGLTIMIGSKGFSLETLGADIEVINEETIHNGTSVKKIEIDTGTTDIKLVPTTSDSIKVHFSGRVSKKVLEDYTFDSQVKGDTLSISIKQSSRVRFGIVIINNLLLTVEAPEKMYDQIRIATGTGDIDIKNMSAENVEINSGTGDITIHTFKGQLAKVNTSTGDIKIMQSDVDLQVSTSTGDLALDEITGTIDIKTQTGDTLLNLEEILHDTNVQSSTGDVTISLRQTPINLQFDFTSSTGDVDILADGLLYEKKEKRYATGKIGNGGPKLQVRTSTGDITFK